ncbi:hypothetical protein KCP75_25150 [Salmonella enterica subsp. enterica]|nr:hypothetical protein KCP75_25150 [Salmonella enterica subsp. enterica]
MSSALGCSDFVAGQAIKSWLCAVRRRKTTPISKSNQPGGYSCAARACAVPDNQPKSTAQRFVGQQLLAPVRQLIRQRHCGAASPRQSRGMQFCSGTSHRCANSEKSSGSVKVSAV